VLDTKTVLLQALVRGPSYGLELVDRVYHITRGEIKILQGRVYPVLRELERDGLVESAQTEPLPIRSGRPRVYYCLTAKGQRVAAQQARAVLALLKPTLGET
jgi:PadR family transcriptional regulator PadR